MPTAGAPWVTASPSTPVTSWTTPPRVSCSPLTAHERLAGVEGLDYERHVRRMWAAFEREGVDGMRPYVDDDVEWVPSLDCDPIRGLAALSSYWNKVNGSRAVVPHAWERHGNCVLVHGSMRTFRDGGF